MEIERISTIVYDWNATVNAFNEAKTVDLEELQKLFNETYVLLDEYSNDKMVPKEISKLLIAMNDLNWLVCHTPVSSIENVYLEIIYLINNLTKYFFFLPNTLILFTYHLLPLHNIHYNLFLNKIKGK